MKGIAEHYQNVDDLTVDSENFLCCCKWFRVLRLGDTQIQIPTQP